MHKPSVFIGSSSEGIDFARAVRSLLAGDADLTLWSEGFFRLGGTFIETLVNSLGRFDFAILVLTPDDWIQSRTVESLSPRDNVIFELGLFMGHLGRSRTIVLHQSGATVKIPTDLSGVTTATYDWPRKDRNHKAAVAVACDSISEVIRDLGLSPVRTSKQLDQVEQRLDWTEGALHQIIAYRPGYFAHQTLCQIRNKADEYYDDGNAHKKRILLLLLDNGYLRPPPGTNDVVFSSDQANKRLFEIAALTPMAELMLKLRDEVSRRPTSG